MGKVLTVWRSTLKNIQRLKANPDHNLSKISKAVNDGFEPERPGIRGSADAQADVKPVDNWKSQKFPIVGKNLPPSSGPSHKDEKIKQQKLNKPSQQEDHSLINYEPSTMDEKVEKTIGSKERAPAPICEIARDQNNMTDETESLDSRVQDKRLEETAPDSPVWYKDEDHSNCMVCNKKFTIRRRKHHCRNCGAVVCAGCSSTRRVLPRKITRKKNPNRRRRICDICDEAMTVVSGASGDYFALVPSMQLAAGNEPKKAKIDLLAPPPEQSSSTTGRRSWPQIRIETNQEVKVAEDSRRASDTPNVTPDSVVSKSMKELQVEDVKIEQKYDEDLGNTSLPKTDKFAHCSPNHVNDILIPGMFRETRCKEFMMEEDSVLKSTIPRTWCNASGKTFNVRIGPDYEVHGKKAPSLDTFYKVFAVDIYSSEKKISNIARFYSIPRRPTVPGEFDIPPVLVINVMTPEYAPSWFSPLIDGPGFSFIIFAELKEWVRETLKEGKLSSSLELYQEFVRGGKDSKYSDCFKVIARICNNKEASKHYGGIAKNLVDNYNGKPFLARTSTQFYYTPKHYFAIDLDIHVFGKIARRGLYSIKDFFGNLVIDCGFVIEGRSNNELPEQLVAALRMVKLDQKLAKPFPLDHLL